MKAVCRALVLSSFSLSACLLGCTTHLAPAPPPAPAPAAAEKPLISPWDTEHVALTQQPYECGAPITIAPDLTVTRSQNKLPENVKAAIYSESDVSLHDLAHRSVTAADNFRRTGSVAAGQCVISLLQTAAGNHSMEGYMATPDAWQEQNQALRAVSIAYLKVRGGMREANLLSPEDDAQIAAWMNNLGHRERENAVNGHCGPTTCTLKNHYGISVAMAAAAVGIVSNDHGLFHWALDRYRYAVSTIDERGMLHYDLRGRYALKFTILSAAALVQIAEFGEANGIPLYAYNGGRIHLLIHTVALGLVDPGPFSEAAGAEQRQHATLETWEVSWASLYDRRFPDPVLTSLLQQVGPGADMWGGEAWGAVNAQ